MSNIKVVWSDPETPDGYNKVFTSQMVSGIADEKIIADFINSYKISTQKIIIDLGIGTGRELIWVDKLSGISKIIGLDYSSPMLSACQKTAKDCLHEIKLIKDNLLNLEVLPDLVIKETNPVIYISLINSFGNFTDEERIKVFKNIKMLLKKDDRLVVTVFKISQQVKAIKKLKDTPHLQTKNEDEQRFLLEALEYGSFPLFWTSVMNKYHQPPRFWYDKEKNDIIVHIDGKVIYHSHRFSKDEIKQEFKEAQLKINQIFEGESMFIAIAEV